MRLNHYLSKQKISQKEFIHEVYEKTGHRLPQGTLAKYLLSQRIPRKKEMLVIYEVTNKMVQPNDFYLEENKGRYKPARVTRDK